MKELVARQLANSPPPLQGAPAILKGGAYCA